MYNVYTTIAVKVCVDVKNDKFVCDQGLSSLYMWRRCTYAKMPTEEKQINHVGWQSSVSLPTWWGCVSDLAIWSGSS